MSTEENKNQVRRVFEEGINQRRLEVYGEILADTYVNHDMPAPPGPEGMKAVVGMFLAAFPDMQMRLDDIIGEGDLVTSRGAFIGTHQGDFMGIPATGKPVNVKYIDLWRFENGKAVENWVRIDMLGMMQQLGVIPAPEQTATA